MLKGPFALCKWKRLMLTPAYQYKSILQKYMLCRDTPDIITWLVDSYWSQNSKEPAWMFGQVTKLLVSYSFGVNPVVTGTPSCGFLATNIQVFYVSQMFPVYRWAKTHIVTRTCPVPQNIQVIDVDPKTGLIPCISSSNPLLSQTGWLINVGSTCLGPWCSAKFQSCWL